jgi:hypothetical protein
MDAQDIKRDNSPKSLFNPLKTNFITSIRDDNNIPQDYIIRSMEIATFPAYLAKHIIRNLITAVQNEREILSTNLKEIEEIRKEIEVDEL